jgi:hypothetical protein
MPRKLKPYLVGDITNQASGQKFEILLDRETKTFFADVLGTKIEAPTAEECAKRAHEQAARVTKMTWQKIIIISAGDISCRHTLSLTYDIHEIGRKVEYKDGHGWSYVERHESPKFGREEETQYSYRDFHEERVKGNPYRGIFVLPWSEAVEAALKEIILRIGAVTKQLRELLGQPDVASRLVMSVERLLPAPEENR